MYCMHLLTPALHLVSGSIIKSLALQNSLCVVVCCLRPEFISQHPFKIYSIHSIPYNTTNPKIVTDVWQKYPRRVLGQATYSAKRSKAFFQKHQSKKQKALEFIVTDMEQDHNMQEREDKGFSCEDSGKDVAASATPAVLVVTVPNAADAAEQVLKESAINSEWISFDPHQSDMQESFDVNDYISYHDKGPVHLVDFDATNQANLDNFMDPSPDKPQQNHDIESTVKQHIEKADAHSGRSCVICEIEGPPSSEGAHKCGVCSKPVHSFGCSTTIEGAEEGFGKSCNICWSCYDNGGSSGSSNILTEHGLAEKEPVIVDLSDLQIDLTPDDDEVFSAGGLPEKKEDGADFSSQADALSMPWQIMSHPQIVSEKFNCRGITLSKFDFKSIIEDRAFITETVVDAFSLLMEDEASNEFAKVFTVSSSALINTTYGITAYLDAWSASPCYFNDIWVIPSTVNKNHWILILVFIRQKFIVVLDSLYGSSLSETIKQQLQVVQYLLSCTYKYCTQQTINWDEWRIFYPKDFPRQPNGYDCAVYVSMFLFSLMKGVKLEKKNFSAPSLAQFRKFMSNKVLEKSAVFSDAPPPPPGPEMAHYYYNEADKAIAAGTLKIDMPWREVPAKTAEDNLPTSTLTFLSTAMANICLATDKVCGAPAPFKCIVKGNNKMFLCEVCREWYHMICIGDNRPVPSANQPYICSLHEFAMTKTRYIRKPARQRISLG